MTTAYAQRAPNNFRTLVPSHRLRVVSSAPGQGREAHKVRDNVRAISVGTTHGHSAESEALQSVLRDLVESIEALQGQLQGDDLTSYNHVPLKTAFRVKARFKLTGKMLPRQLPDIE